MSAPESFGSGPVGEIARLAHLRTEVERDIVERVHDAVQAGHTWTEVAVALGVSRQSAHERYAPRILDLARGRIQPGRGEPSPASAAMSPTRAAHHDVSPLAVEPGTTREDTAPTAEKKEHRMDALDLLIADHNRVRGLFTRARDAHEKDDQTALQTLASEIFEELDVHATIEEELFYPWAHDLSDEIGETIDEGIEEHRVAKTLMQEAGQLDPTDDQWVAKLTVLMENVDHHAEEEESEMFPKIRSASSAEDRKALGERLESRKAELGAPVLADKIDLTTEELRKLASEQAIPGRSSMDHEQLAATVSP